MLASHDASIGLGASRHHDRSRYDDNHPQHELDEAEASRGRQCLKKTTKFLFSHIGLVGLVVVYAVAGGFLFQLLEEHQEKFSCQEASGEQLAQITKLKQKLVAYIQYNTTSSTVTKNPYDVKDNTSIAFAKIGAMLYDYRNFVEQTSSKYRYYDNDCSQTSKWTYPNALLFAITIITTIGYGNITPITWEGQLCCICYATIGIPIFLLCVANISGVLGEMFRFLYGKVFCKPCAMVKERRALAQQAQSAEEGGATNPQQKKPMDAMKNNPDMDEEELRRNQRVAVPLTVTMVIIAAYIWIGSALFHSFEGWSMIQAGYFCFITLATIGFGDFVPGQRQDDPNASAKLILGAIYVLFGMAILAMCFDLMQEEIVAKFRWIGRKIGIVDSDELEEEDNSGQPEKPPNGKGKERSATLSSVDLDPAMTARTTPDAAPRKLSPRNNLTRIYPLNANMSDERTLHQRVTPSKAH